MIGTGAGYGSDGFSVFYAMEKFNLQKNHGMRKEPAFANFFIISSLKQ